MKQFVNTLKIKGLTKTQDGFVKDKFGRILKIKYNDILNDFGRNISKKENFRLSDKDKKQVLNFLKLHNIRLNAVKNKILRDAYNDESLISKTTPAKAHISRSDESDNDDMPTTSGYQKSKKKKPDDEASWKEVRTYWKENFSNDD